MRRRPRVGGVSTSGHVGLNLPEPRGLTRRTATLARDANRLHEPTAPRPAASAPAHASNTPPAHRPAPEPRVADARRESRATRPAPGAPAARATAAPNQRVPSTTSARRKQEPGAWCLVSGAWETVHLARLTSWRTRLAAGSYKAPRHHHRRSSRLRS